MKTIGFIGGLSCQSSIEYYRIMVAETRKRLKRHHSPKLIMVSVDFDEIVGFMHAKDWRSVLTILVNAAQQLEQAGADFILIGCNTVHKLADLLKETIQLPFLHIIDTVGIQLQRYGLTKVSLLGTRFTMEDGFYQRYLAEYYKIQVITPDLYAREYIHNVIFNELCYGKIDNQTKAAVLDIVNSQQKSGAEAIILGCTELPLLLKNKDVVFPLLDSTRLHASAAVHFALSK